MPSTALKKMNTSREKSVLSQTPGWFRFWIPKSAAQVHLVGVEEFCCCCCRGSKALKAFDEGAKVKICNQVFPVSKACLVVCEGKYLRR